jgi:hypothetical protein
VHSLYGGVIASNIHLCVCVRARARVYVCGVLGVRLTARTIGKGKTERKRDREREERER